MFSFSPSKKRAKVIAVRQKHWENLIITFRRFSKFFLKRSSREKSDWFKPESFLWFSSGFDECIKSSYWNISCRLTMFWKLYSRSCYPNLLINCNAPIPLYHWHETSSTQNEWVSNNKSIVWKTTGCHKQS